MCDMDATDSLKLCLATHRVSVGYPRLFFVLAMFEGIQSLYKFTAQLASLDVYCGDLCAVG